MKQNAVGLSNICILSTAVIIMISTTVSLYAGMEDVLRTRYPRNIIVSASDVSDEMAGKLDAVIAELTAKDNIDQGNVIRYRSMPLITIQNGTDFTVSQTVSYTSENIAFIEIIPVEYYNKMENKSVSLSGEEVLIYALRGGISGSTINFNGFELSIKEHLDSLILDGEMSAVLANSYYIVVDGMDTIRQVYNYLTGMKLIWKNCHIITALMLKREEISR